MMIIIMMPMLRLVCKVKCRLVYVRQASEKGGRAMCLLWIHRLVCQY